MRRAKVHRDDEKVSQGVVNQLKRGQFVVPGFDKDSFDIPFMPHDNIEWMPDHEDVLLKMEYSAELPDLRPDNVDVDEFFEDKPFDAEHLDDIIDVDEASTMTGMSRRSIQRKCQTGKIHGIKIREQWLLSASQLINNEDVPIVD
jgi:hypothetical protein